MLMFIWMLKTRPIMIKAYSGKVMQIHLMANSVDIPIETINK